MKNKKTILSKMFGVVVSFALVVGMLISSVVTLVGNAEDFNGSKNGGKFIGYIYGLEGSSYYDEESGKYSTRILIDDEWVHDIIEAKKLVDNKDSFIEMDYLQSSFTSAKAVFDAVWADVFAAPQAVIARITSEIKPIVDRTTGVVYSDLETYNSVMDDFNALDGGVDYDSSKNVYNEESITAVDNDAYQKYYVGTFPEWGTMEQCEEKLSALTEDLDDLAKRIDELPNEGVVYSDKEELEDVEKKYENLKQADKDYVDNKAKEENIKTTRDAFDDLVEDLDDLAKRIDELPNENVKYSDKEELEDVEEKYDELEESNKAYVDEKATEENIGATRNAFDELVNELDALVERINNLPNENVKYSDKEELEDVEEKYGELEASSQAYIDENSNEENIQTTRNAFDELVEKLDDLVKRINELPNGDVVYSDKEKLENIEEEYENLEESNKDYVNVNSDEENIDLTREAFDDLVEELDELAERINNLPNEEVKYSDKEELEEVEEKYNALEDSNKAYVDENSEEANIQTTRNAFDELVNELDALVEDIDDLPNENVVYSDKETLEDVEERYNALEESNKAYVDEQATEENIQATREAFDDLVEELDDLAERIDALPNENVKYSDKEELEDIEEKYGALEESNKAYVDEKSEEANIQTTRNAFDELVNELDALKDRIDALPNENVKYSDKEELEEVEEKYGALEASSQTYVDENSNEENIQTTRNAFDELVNELNALKDRINNLPNENVKYSDKEELEDVEEKYGALESSNQAYVDENSEEANIQTTRNAFDELIEGLDALAYRIDALPNENVKYSDKEELEDIEEKYGALEESNKAYVDEQATEENIQATRNAFDDLVEELDALAERIDALPNENVKYSDKEELEEVEEKYGALESSNQNYVDEKSEEANIQTTREAFDALVEELDALAEDIDDLPNEDVKYSDRETLESVEDRYGALEESNKAYVDEKSEEANIQTTRTALDALVEAWKLRVAHLVDDTVLAENVDNFLSNVKAEDVASKDRFDFTTVVAVRADYDTDYAPYIDDENNPFVDAVTALAVVEARVEEIYDAWRISVAKLIDEEVETAEEAENIFANTDLEECVVFNLTKVNELLEDYNDRFNAHETSQTALKTAYDFLNSITKRAEDLNKELSDEIKKLIEDDKENRLNEDDTEKAKELQKIINEIENNEDEDQKEELLSSIEPYTLQDIRDVIDKILASNYYKQAVDEMAREVKLTQDEEGKWVAGEDGYYTVEGLAFEKSLFSLYGEFDKNTKTLLASAYEKLVAIDEAYSSRPIESLLNYEMYYNKEAIDEKIGEINGKIDNINIAQKKLEGDYKAADAELKEDYIAAIAKADEETAKLITDAYIAADEKLKEDYNQKLSDLKSELKEAYQEADDIIKGKIDELSDKVDEKFSNASKDANNELFTALIDSLKDTSSKMYTGVAAIVEEMFNGFNNIITSNYESADTALEQKITKAYKNADKVLKEEIEEEIEEAKKLFFIIVIALGVVSLILVICVIVLFIKKNRETGEKYLISDEDRQ